MQAIQKKLEKDIEEYEKKEFSFLKSGGAIAIKVSGSLKISEIKIDDSLIDKQGKDTLEDMLKIAFNEVVKEIELGRVEIENKVKGDLPRGII